MKSVLISIRPIWVQLIASGKKTVEIRKTRPKLKTPFKCYIYCTLSGSKEFFNETLKGDVVAWNKGEWAKRKGTVIGEFTCNNILEIGRRGFNNNFDYCYESLNIFGNDDIESYITAVRKSCLSKNELHEYAKNNSFLYGWYISDLVIYDKPKGLSRFVVEGDCYGKNCEKCGWFSPGTGYYDEDDCNLYYKYINREVKPLFRPPQSWCYVEEVPNDNQ